MASTINPAVKKTIYFDPQGDRIIIVNGPDDTRVGLVVSSAVMSLACEPWRVMFRGRFMEAAEPERPIYLPEDDLEGLTILLNIAHLKNDLVPPYLTLAQFSAVAVLTDKYHCMRLVQPWIKRWLSEYDSLAIPVAFEHWEFMWVAWTFGLSSVFQDYARKLLAHRSLDGYVDRTSGTRVCYPSATVKLPPHIEVNILDKRFESIEKIVTAYQVILTQYKEASNYERPILCKAHLRPGKYVAPCDSVAYNAMVDYLKGWNLDHDTTPEEVDWSVWELDQILGEDRFGHRIRSANADYKKHEVCFSNAGLENVLHEARQGSPVEVFHLAHVRRQWEIVHYNGLPWEVNAGQRRIAVLANWMSLPAQSRSRGLLPTSLMEKEIEEAYRAATT